jgi:hypothetical protein
MDQRRENRSGSFRQAPADNKVGSLESRGWLLLAFGPAPNGLVLSPRRVPAIDPQDYTLAGASLYSLGVLWASKGLRVASGVGWLCEARSEVGSLSRREWVRTGL